MNKPSIGRVVHYVRGGAHLAATIGLVEDDGSVTLCALNPFADAAADIWLLVKGVQYDENMAEGTYHWPEMVF